MTDSPFADIPNEALFLQTFAVLELLQHREPDPERADILQRLRPVRNYLIHVSDLGSEDVDAALTDVLEYLRRLEMTSLGTPEAQRVRQRAEPGVIVEALLRSATEGPAIGAHYTNNPGCKGASMTESYVGIWPGDYHLNCDCCGLPTIKTAHSKTQERPWRDDGNAGQGLVLTPKDTQLCGTCKQYKPLEDYSPSKRGQAGSQCKSCNNAARRKDKSGVSALPHEPLLCTYCGKWYVPKQLKKNAKYCSRQCWLNERAAEAEARRLAKACCF